ncbi:hypothetical protein DBV15_03419 [Temnothorax longispinosus]|uniref:Uncharacterized protein n=1 Tax=Temnothorax longispinosus TaxID=300112 RepID=A0A4S2KLQ9_9HYME|nr:hypothetical protein DBV15_03419 [Temnothorax longispinosus]
MKAGIIKFIEGERPSRQSIVVRVTRRSSILRATHSVERKEEKIREIERTWAMRERKSKGNNELVARVNGINRKDGLSEIQYILSFIILRDVIYSTAINPSSTCPTQMPPIADIGMIYELSPAEGTERFNYDDTAVKYFSGYDLANHSCLIEVSADNVQNTAHILDTKKASMFDRDQIAPQRWLARYLYGNRLDTPTRTSIGVAENNDNREAPSRALSLFSRAGVFTSEWYDAPREKEHDPREGHNQLTSTYGVLEPANCDCSLCRVKYCALDSNIFHLKNV